MILFPLLTWGLSTKTGEYALNALTNALFYFNVVVIISDSKAVMDYLVVLDYLTILSGMNMIPCSSPSWASLINGKGVLEF